MITIEDVDDDQDLDIICKDRWFENVDGLGNFDSLPNTIPIEDSNATLIDYDLDGDVDVHGDGWWLENRRIGDSNNDGHFGTEDLTAVMASGKYELEDVEATFDEGDWNQDGQFNSNDLVYAFFKLAASVRSYRSGGGDELSTVPRRLGYLSHANQLPFCSVLDDRLRCAESGIWSGR